MRSNLQDRIDAADKTACAAILFRYAFYSSGTEGLLLMVNRHRYQMCF